MTRLFRFAFAATVLLAVIVGTAHGETLFVANNGIDQDFCGHADVRPPCRSITLAINHALAGDRILVGPGVYTRDLGETGAPGCSCLVAVNKRLSVVSSDGAAATVIDGRSALVEQTVLVIADGAEFGRLGQGFTVTNTGAQSGTSFVNAGIVIDATDVKVRGNEVFSAFTTASDGTGILGNFGIATVAANESVTIEENHVVGWGTGILAQGCCKTVSKNHVSLSSGSGIQPGASTSASQGHTVVGNVSTANGSYGISVLAPASVHGNALIGNLVGGIALDAHNSLEQPVSVTVQGNNIFGNAFGSSLKNCGLSDQSEVGATATNNYWGASTGPGADPADDVCNLSGHTVTTTPFATQPFTIKPLLRP